MCAKLKLRIGFCDINIDIIYRARMLHTFKNINIKVFLLIKIWSRRTRQNDFSCITIVHLASWKLVNTQLLLVISRDSPCLEGGIAIISLSMLSRIYWWCRTWNLSYVATERREPWLQFPASMWNRSLQITFHIWAERAFMSPVLRLISMHLGLLKSSSPLWLVPAKSVLLLNGAPIRKCLLVSFQQYLVSLNNFSEINVTRKNEFSLAPIQPKLASVDSDSQKHHGPLAVLCSCEIESRFH